MTANRDLLDADSLIRLEFGSSTEKGMRPWRTISVLRI